jgi:hypothetical protein
MHHTAYAFSFNPKDTTASKSTHNWYSIFNGHLDVMLVGVDTNSTTKKTKMFCRCPYP